MHLKDFKAFGVSLFLLLAATDIAGQGCSDAGFCSAADFKHQIPDSSSFANQVRIGVSNGIADHFISIFSPYIEYKRQVSEKMAINSKIIALSQSGNEISSFGLSDVFFTANYKISESIKITAGLKIPLSDGNAKYNDLPLPMDYQYSLGTFDLILGAGFNVNKFEFVVALQQPFTQNKNEFIQEIYPEQSVFSNFHSTRNYKRSGDVLFRASYSFKLIDKFSITPGLLPVYHLQNDKFTGTDGIAKEISGSQGLTLNGILYFDYSVDKKNNFQLGFGSPFISRDVRPDGLTRKYVATLEYGFKF